MNRLTSKAQARLGRHSSRSPRRFAARCARRCSATSVTWAGRLRWRWRSGSAADDDSRINNRVAGLLDKTWSLMTPKRTIGIAMTGSLTLCDHPGDIVRLSCERCGRTGQYRKKNLIAQLVPTSRCPTCGTRSHSVSGEERRTMDVGFTIWD
jgi:hypothetical protein